MPAAPPRTSYGTPTPPPNNSSQPPSMFHAPYPSLDGPLGQHLATNSAAGNRNPASSSGDGGPMGEGAYPSSHRPSYSSPGGVPAPGQPNGSSAGRGSSGYPDSASHMPSYPGLGSHGQDGTGSAPQPTAPQMAGGQGEAVADSDPQGSWWNQLPSAPQPPPAANQGMGRVGSDAAAGSPTHRAPTGQASLATMQDDDSDMCVVCMEKPCAAGFVHGNRCASQRLHRSASI